MQLVFDIETVAIQDNDINTVDKVHCLCLTEVGSKEVSVYHDDPIHERHGTIKDGLIRLSSADTIICHNSIGFDLPVLKRIYGFSHHNVHDTFILSQLFFNNPAASFNHGLDGWGKMFGIPKPVHEDWSTLSAAMLRRCCQDVLINEKVWRACTTRFKNKDYDASQAIKLEYEVYKTYVSNNRPWAFDVERAEKGLKELEEHLEKTEEQLKYQFPLVLDPASIKEYKRVWKTTIDPTKTIKDNMLHFVYNYCIKAEINPHHVAGPFTAIRIRHLNFSSTKEKIDALLAMGWEPDEKTPAGNPSLSRSNFIGVPKDIKKLLKQYNKTKHCVDVVKGLLSRQTNNSVRGFAFTCGTNTARFTHAGIANVPRVGSTGGELLRGCFTIPSEDYIIIGVDAASIENRVEGHLTWDYDNGTYARFLLETEDIHCFTEDTEYLTEDGWKVYKDIGRYEKIATWKDGTVRFDTPKLWNVAYVNTQIDSYKGLLDVTQNHRMLVQDARGGEARHVLSADLNTTNGSLRWVPGGIKSGRIVAPERISFEVAVQAGGSFNHNKVSLEFKKQRKIDRMRELLASNNLEFKERVTKRGSTHFNVVAPKWELLDNEKNFSWDVLSLDTRSLEVLINEIAFWDGTVTQSGSIVYEQVGRSRSVHVVQTAASLCGLKATYASYKRDGRSLRERVYISVQQNGYSVLSTPKTSVMYSGYVACPTTEDGNVLVRKHGKITVQGNSYNADIWGVTREDAKSPAYALNYNCSPSKLAKLLSRPESEGEQLRNAYFDGPRKSSMDLNNDVVKYVTSRWGEYLDIESMCPYIVGIDGRPLFIRSTHSAKNTLIQNAATVIMKYAYVWLHKQLQKRNIEAWIQIFYHDEFQIVTHISEEERVKKLALQSIEVAGKVFKMKVPMLGNAQVGKTWADTH